jgi:hypothetical protein
MLNSKEGAGKFENVNCVKEIGVNDNGDRSAM